MGMEHFMPVTLSSGKPFVASSQVPVAVEIPKPKKRGGGSTKPKKPLFDLDQPSRLRNAEFQWHLGGMSASAFHSRRRAGLIPPPDGNDGRPFWFSETVRAYLTKGGA
ncbi:hypothetical protein ADM96_15715 [Burkholderia sp. ST111]|nr:hypothetical protein ADM96_15715 [Burkholderia sp. ST111]